MFGAHTRIHKILHIKLIANQLYMYYNVDYMCVHQTYSTKNKSLKDSNLYISTRHTGQGYFTCRTCSTIARAMWDRTAWYCPKKLGSTSRGFDVYTSGT